MIVRRGVAQEHLQAIVQISRNRERHDGRFGRLISGVVKHVLHPARNDIAQQILIDSVRVSGANFIDGESHEVRNSDLQ
jgi:hypothetical protein